MVLRYSDSSRRRTRSQSESTMKGFGPACSVPAGAWELGARPRAMRTAAPVSITAMPIRSPREGARRLLRGGPRFLRAKVFRSVTEVSAALPAAGILGAGAPGCQGRGPHSLGQNLISVHLIIFHVVSVWEQGSGVLGMKRNSIVSLPTASTQVFPVFS